MILMYIDIRMKEKNGEKLKTAIIEVQLPLLPGSISTARSTCGKPKCGCHQDPDKRHGVYYRWTGFLDGKRTTKTLTAEEAEECRIRIRNYRQFQKIISNLVKQSLKQAPWTKRKK